MSRQIIGLRWARPCTRPSCIPVARPRGAKAAGLRYERALANAQCGAVRGQWWEFEDANGHGWCQTDVLLRPDDDCAIVQECKYSWTLDGHVQLERLYLPVVQRALGVTSVIGIVVCKRLVPEMTLQGVTIASTLQGALNSAASGRRVAWHWLGGPLLVPQAPPMASPVLDESVLAAIG